jgi:hypothetical protein
MLMAARVLSDRLAIGQGGRARADRLDQPFADSHMPLAVDHVAALKRGRPGVIARAGARRSA